MKSLDMDIATTYFRAYDTCRVRLEFTGGYQKDKMQGSDVCSVTVPYRSFSKKLQTIQRLGGKIVNISILDGKLAFPQISTTVETTLEPEAVTPEIIPVVETEAIAPEIIPVVEPEAIAPEPEPIVETEAIAPEIIPVVEPEAIALESESVAVAVRETEEVSVEPKAFTVDVVKTKEIVPELEPFAVDVVETKAISLELEPFTVDAVETEVIAPALESFPVVETETIAPEKIAKELTTKPKKPKSTSKSNHGFNKPSKIATETIATPIENIVFDEVVDEVAELLLSEPIVEIGQDLPLSQEITEFAVEDTAPEIFVEPVAESISETLAETLPEPALEAVLAVVTEPVLTDAIETIADVSIPTSSTVELPEAIAPSPKSESKLESKSKKTKISTKSAKGFNKPKEESKTKRTI